MTASSTTTDMNDGGATRAGFLRKAGLTGAALVGGGALLGLPGTASAGHTDTIPDVDILNFALTLEYLEATFYSQALGGGGAPGVAPSGARFDARDVTRAKRFKCFKQHGKGHGNGVTSSYGSSAATRPYDLLSTIRDHEITHVKFLVGALGGAAVKPCTFDFTGALTSLDSFLKTAQVLENTGVMAYDGAIRYVDGGDYLQAGAQIATVEARHAAYLNLINGDSPFPDAFDQGKKPSEILAAAMPFIVSCPQEVTDLFSRLP